MSSEFRKDQVVIFYTWLICGMSLLVVSVAGDSHKWDYGDNDHGPAHWAHDFEACGGKHQSPVNLTRPFLKNSMGAIQLINYDEALLETKITNNGHTAQLSAANVTAEISGGLLKGTYRFLQMHFHWGSGDKQGSEHFIDGKPFPMEAHLLHINKKYELQEALSQPDGLAVLGVLFTVEDNDNPNLTPIVDAVDDIKRKGENKKIKGSFNLKSIIPKDPSYMSYPGSLTTPQCNEVVTWTIFTSPLPISRKQLKEFRELHFGDDKSPLMVDNFRPLQFLHDRKIMEYRHQSGKTDDGNDSATIVNFSSVHLLCALLIYCINLYSYSRTD